jgi:hypothetical protein
MAQNSSTVNIANTAINWKNFSHLELIVVEKSKVEIQRFCPKIAGVPLSLSRWWWLAPATARHNVARAWLAVTLASRDPGSIYMYEKLTHPKRSTFSSPFLHFPSPGLN